jgi:hypothetical protein
MHLTLSLGRWGAAAVFASCAATCEWLVTLALEGGAPGPSIILIAALLPGAVALALAARGARARAAALAGLATLAVAAAVLGNGEALAGSGLLGLSLCLLASAFAGRGVRWTAVSVLLLLAGGPFALGALGVVAGPLVGGILAVPALAVAGLALATGRDEDAVTGAA